jgi:hypothetical protein
MEHGSRRIDNPEYVQGQIEGLQAVVLGLANLLLDQQEFRAESLTRIESVRTAITFSPASDAWLDGLNVIEDWVKALT